MPLPLEHTVVRTFTPKSTGPYVAAIFDMLSHLGAPTYQLLLVRAAEGLCVVSEGAPATFHDGPFAPDEDGALRGFLALLVDTLREENGRVERRLDRINLAIRRGYAALDLEPR